RHTRSKRDWSSDVCSSDLKQPQQGVLVSARGPEVSELPLEKKDDNQHFDADHGRGDAGEEADGEARSSHRLRKIGEIRQRFRKRQLLCGNVWAKLGNGNVQHLLNPVRQQNRAGGEAYEGIRKRREAPVEARERWKDQFRFAIGGHCILPDFLAKSFEACMYNTVESAPIPA